MSFYFGDKSWPEIQEHIDKNSLIILPYGTIEEHGKHLPINTDLVIADGIARKVAETVKDMYPVLVLPGWWSGYSIRKMSKWPGVIRVRCEILIETFYDIMESLVEMGFKKLLCINGHGQNPEMIKLAARRIADNYDLMVITSNWWSVAAETIRKVRKSEIGGAVHGGEIETALMLYFSDLVDMSKATKEDFMNYRTDFFSGDMAGSASGGAFLSTWFVQESKTGIYGDPTVATRETGRLIVEATAAKYAKLIEEYMNF